MENNPFLEHSKNLTQLLSQAEAFSALFTDGQVICFQETEKDKSPLFLTYPFKELPPAKYRRYVLNPFQPGSDRRLKANLLYQQGFTIEQDCISIQMQRAWFADIIGQATVANFSGNKSMHYHCLFGQLTKEQASELAELLKRAFFSADWQLLDDAVHMGRTPGATRENGKEQSIDYIGTRLDAATAIARLKEKTTGITAHAQIANTFSCALARGSYGSLADVENGNGPKLPSVWQAMKNMLENGYTIGKDSWEYKTLAEIFQARQELLPMSLDALIEKAKEKLPAMIEAEQDAQLAQIRMPTRHAKENTWKYRTAEAMQGQWQNFYEQHGITKIKMSSQVGWVKGYTDGRHKNKTPGFAFNLTTGFFHDFYTGEKGFPQEFLQKYQSMEIEQAWLFLAEQAKVEPRNYTTCQYCGKGELFWENSRLHEKSGEPHQCNAKKKNFDLKKFEKKKQEAAAANSDLEGVKIIKEIETDKHDYLLVTDKGIYYKTVVTNPLLGESYPVIELVCHDPVIIAERLQQVDDTDNIANVRLTWGEQSAIVPMSYLQPKFYDKLSNLGIRVITSQKSKLLAEYFLAALGEMIPQKTLYKRAGWRGQEFVLGNCIIGPDGERAACMSDDAPAIGVAGDYDTWRVTVERFTNDPQVQIILGASAIAPALDMLTVESCTIHQWCDSSAGKSFNTRLAASIWGKYEDNAGKGLVRSWNSTSVGHEFYFHQMNHLPCFLDESQLCQDSVIIEKTVYQFGNGHGRTRGTKVGGVDILRTWKTFLLSTGEKQITEISTQAGLGARCIEIYRQKHEEITETEFRKTNILLAENYGHAGKMIINYLIHHREAVKEMYISILESLEKDPVIIALTQKNDVTKRQLPRWAAILTGTQINKSLFNFQENAKAVMAEMRKSLGEMQEKPTAAIGCILEEIYLSNKEHFNERTPGGLNQNAKGEVYGFYDTAKDTIFFFPQILNRELEKRGYCRSQLAKLVKDGQILTDKEGKWRVVEWYLGRSVRFYAYKPASIVEEKR
jgi:hypothetical protein